MAKISDAVNTLPFPDMMQSGGITCFPGLLQSWSFPATKRPTRNFYCFLAWWRPPPPSPPPAVPVSSCEDTYKALLGPMGAGDVNKPRSHILDDPFPSPPFHFLSHKRGSCVHLRMRATRGLERPLRFMSKFGLSMAFCNFPHCINNHSELR